MDACSGGDQSPQLSSAHKAPLLSNILAAPYPGSLQEQVPPMHPKLLSLRQPLVRIPGPHGHFCVLMHLVLRHTACCPCRTPTPSSFITLSLPHRIPFAPSLPAELVNRRAHMRSSTKSQSRVSGDGAEDPHHLHPRTDTDDRSHHIIL